MTADPGRYEAEQVWAPWSEQLLGWGADFHDLLLGDDLRMRAYRQAIGEVVRPGDVVVDLGTGTGVLARWAVEAGAARAYGIERDPGLLDRAVAAAADEGLADRFVPVAGLSFDVTLPEPADLIVSEILGNLVDNEDCCRILDDAARRFLAPGGRMLPQRVERYLVPVEATRAHAGVAALGAAPIGAAGAQRPGAGGAKSGEAASFDLSAARAAEETTVTSRTLLQASRPFDAYYDVILPREGYLASPRLDRAFAFTADTTDPTDPTDPAGTAGTADPTSYRSDLVFAVGRAGTFTGFKGWFVADLAPTVALDISGDRIDGGAARTSSDSWKHAYLPVERPVPVEPHDRICLSLSRLAPEGDGGPAFAQSYTWEGTVRRGDQVVGRFAQRTPSDGSGGPTAAPGAA